jgi:hypothetical protein
MSNELRLETLTLKREVKLTTETCSTCGILYAMEEEFQKERLADKQSFYCPKGHSQKYTGESEADKLRRERNLLKQQIAQKDDEIKWQREAKEKAREEAQHERRRANGYKGHATRITKRAKAGVCPCCKRHFIALERHMATKHPTFTPMALEVIDGGKAVA